MKPIRTRARWILITCSALFSASAIAGIPSAANECFSDLVETTPSSDFTTLDGGAVVRHRLTGLEWRRCPEGMDWTGTNCSGLPGLYSWQGALLRADLASGWRLPNVNEFRSIVERCRRNPAVNPQVFPDTPWSGFWSASPWPGFTGGAWDVGFGSGGDGWSAKHLERHVRLVRGVQ